MSTRDAVLAVWSGTAVLVAAGAVACSSCRLPGYGALARAATDGPVRRTVLVLAWMWLGWHTFAR